MKSNLSSGGDGPGIEGSGTMREQDRQAMPVDQEQPPRLEFPVVAIGASAGGLEAAIEFLGAMPSDSGMAFVLIQHLPPDRESMLAEILSKRTEMRVLQVEDGMRVEANHLYVIRPGHTLTIHEGALRLGERLSKPGHNHPIDDFFRSLAEEQRERGIAIVMSGMGSNGSAGAQAIKAVGGLCIAQDPETAKFPSMPRHLIDAGWADVILRPQDMPDLLVRYARHPYARQRGEHDSILRRERSQFNEILTILRARTHHDFSGYKPPTVLRRIERRMGLNQVTKLADYVQLLRQSPAEATSLSDDLMIHVTGFFRDADAWEALREKVIVPLVAERDPEKPIRCWVAACSSGEEAYTLGMLLTEAAEAAGKRLDIKIFATDTAARSLGMARGGVYPAGIESEMPPPRIERFFEKDDSIYRVRKELREMVVFAPHNLLQDPPFSRLDICTCRNLLIYLEPEMQKRTLALLHFGIREGGALLLGNSETVSGSEDLFEPLDKKWRLFRRVGPTRHGAVDFPFPALLAAAGQRERASAPGPRHPIPAIANRVLLERYTPAAVVVDRDHRIVYFHGSTEPYLSNPRGEPTRELISVVREPLRGAVRTALHQAMSTNERATARGAISDDGHAVRVSVTAVPLDARAPGYCLVSFEERPETQLPAGTGDLSAMQHGQLRDELQRVRHELQTTIEELQASNEELKASNEEVTSVNEELQSTNEELETSKEELQSLNEELTTVNSQLQVKMEELEATTNDLGSLLSSTDIAVIFLDTSFRIRRFTPAVKDLLELIPTDLGRPLSDLSRKFDDPNLPEDARVVLERLIPLQREVRSESGRWYVRRILPYRTIDNRIDGVVMTFVDITERKSGEEALARAKEQAEAANAAKDRFLANVSHELRTPLSAILLWSKIVKDRKQSPEQIEEALAAIEQSAQSQKALIEDLLDTSQIASGRMRIRPRMVDLRSVARAAIEALRLTAEVKGVSLELEAPKDAAETMADPERLQQVIWNLLSNAIKFTPKGGRVTVGVAVRGPSAEIRVSDTGQGMAADFLPRVFQRFTQAEDGSVKTSRGMGLGLSICKEIVELHGGTIRAESDGDGRGAIFTVRLPMRAEAMEPGASEGPGNGLSGVRVLLVEDDDGMRRVTRALLKQAGAEVIEATCAREALETFAKARADVILSDIAMPEVDGYELLRQIRAEERKGRGSPTPAVAVTAFGGDEPRQKALAAGFNDYLAKPLDARQLVAALARLAGRR